MKSLELGGEQGHDRCVKDYPKDESFIWKDLIVRAEKAVESVRKAWRKNQSQPRMLFSWPASHLVDKDGIEVTDLVSFAIPDGMPTFKAAVEMARRTEAYGLLLIEQRDKELKLILESHHGTRSWTFPIRKHGDVWALEKESAADNTDCIGVLWRRSAERN